MGFSLNLHKETCPSNGRTKCCFCNMLYKKGDARHYAGGGYNQAKCYFHPECYLARIIDEIGIEMLPKAVLKFKEHGTDSDFIIPEVVEKWMMTLEV